jgi:cytochrome c oxidase subunit I
MFGGFYFWWPKFTGKKLNENLARWHFWTLFIGFQVTFLVQHWAGIEGMPRRVAHYPLLPDSVATLNQISSAGSFLLGASTLFFLWNVYITSRHGQQETADDPWGYANSLEWVTSCPPPRHNFTSIPRIRSERPAFDLHYPHVMSGRRRAAPSGPPAQQDRQPPRRRP